MSDAVLLIVSIGTFILGLVLGEIRLEIRHLRRYGRR